MQYFNYHHCHCHHHISVVLFFHRKNFINIQNPTILFLVILLHVVTCLQGTSFGTFQSISHTVRGWQDTASIAFAEEKIRNGIWSRSSSHPINLDMFVNTFWNLTLDWNGFSAPSLPRPLKELIVSHPVYAWLPGKALHISCPMDVATLLISIYLMRDAIPHLINILHSISFRKDRHSIMISVSSAMMPHQVPGYWWS